MDMALSTRHRTNRRHRTATCRILMMICFLWRSHHTCSKKIWRCLVDQGHLGAYGIKAPRYVLLNAHANNTARLDSLPPSAPMRVLQPELAPTTHRGFRAAFVPWCERSAYTTPSFAPHIDLASIKFIGLWCNCPIYFILRPSPFGFCVATDRVGCNTTLCALTTLPVRTFSWFVAILPVNACLPIRKLSPVPQIAADEMIFSQPQ